MRWSLTEAPSLPRCYPVSSVLRTSPSPHTAQPVSRELPVDPCCRSPLGLPVLRLVSFACMPSPLPRQDRWSLFARASHRRRPSPFIGRVGSCIALFRGLLSVHSRYGLHARQVAIATLYTEGSNSFVTSAAASTATGWSEPVPGRDLLPLKTSAFSRRTIIQVKCLVVAPGGNWDDTWKEARPLKVAIEQRKLWLDSSEVVRNIEELLSKAPKSGTFPTEMCGNIKEILGKVSPWHAVKSAGKSAIPAGDATRHYQQLQKLCNAYGLWNCSGRGTRRILQVGGQ